MSIPNNILQTSRNSFHNQLHGFPITTTTMMEMMNNTSPSVNIHNGAGVGHLYNNKSFPTTTTPAMISRSTTTLNNNNCNNVIELNKYDVVCGRNKFSRSFEGNKIFRQVITQYCPFYQKASTRVVKNRITHQVISIVHANGGRFLMIDEDKSTKTDTVFKQASNDYIYEKVSHALRSTKIKKNSKCATISAPTSSSLVSMLKESERRRASMSSINTPPSFAGQQLSINHTALMGGMHPSTCIAADNNNTLQAALRRNSLPNISHQSISHPLMEYISGASSLDMYVNENHQNYLQHHHHHGIYNNQFNNNNNNPTTMLLHQQQTSQQPHLVSPPETQKRVINSEEIDNILSVSTNFPQINTKNYIHKKTTQQQQQPMLNNRDLSLLRSDIGEIDFDDDNESSNRIINDDDNNNKDNDDTIIRVSSMIGNIGGSSNEYDNSYIIGDDDDDDDDISVLSLNYHQVQHQINNYDDKRRILEEAGNDGTDHNTSLYEDDLTDFLTRMG